MCITIYMRLYIPIKQQQNTVYTVTPFKIIAEEPRRPHEGFVILDEYFLFFAAKNQLVQRFNVTKISLYQVDEIRSHYKHLSHSEVYCISLSKPIIFSSMYELTTDTFFPLCHSSFDFVSNQIK